MNNIMFFFVEKTPGTCVQHQTSQIKSSWSCLEEYKNVNKCQRFLLQHPRQAQWRNQEKTALKFLKQNRNVNIVVNDTDTNIGPACTDQENVKKESKRQL